MPFKDPVKAKEYRRLRYLKNKEKDRLYHIENKERIKEYVKKYQQTEQGKKKRSIAKWRYQGILCFDFDLLYDIFLKTSHCEFCNVELTTGRYNTSTTKMLDHDHNITDRFNIRGVLCNVCNIKDVLN